MLRRFLVAEMMQRCVCLVQVQDWAMEIFWQTQRRDSSRPSSRSLQRLSWVVPASLRQLPRRIPLPTCWVDGLLDVLVSVKQGAMRTGLIAVFFYLC